MNNERIIERSLLLIGCDYILIHLFNKGTIMDTNIIPHVRFDWNRYDNPNDYNLRQSIIELVERVWCQLIIREGFYFITQIFYAVEY